MPKTPWEWENNQIHLNRDSKTNSPPDEIVINDLNNNLLTPYSQAVTTIADLIKDKQGAGLSKEESIEELLYTFKLDVIKQLNLKIGVD